MKKERSKLNKTIVLNQQEIDRLSTKLIHLNSPVTVDDIENVTIHQDMMEVINFCRRNLWIYSL